MKSIEVSIAGRPYPVKVTADEEQIVLDTVEEINQKVSDLQHTYRGKDKIDYLSMALLTYALDYAKNKSDHQNIEDISKKADDIFAVLENID
jgi:cell division protein ZapA (FtsZ GTPase activity inhibitor)